MFKFLFGGGAKTETVIETDRARFTRLTKDLNELIDSLAVKPRVTVVPGTGHVVLETPEQFPDEALALPAPTAASAAGIASDAKDTTLKADPAAPAAATPKGTEPGAPAPKG